MREKGHLCDVTIKVSKLIITCTYYVWSYTLLTLVISSIFVN